MSARRNRVNTDLRVGTSGWNYEHWFGTFYPDGLEPSRLLEFYQSHLDSVEVNNSFYQLPSEDTLRSWTEEVDADFVFALKASRYLTHMKKLKDSSEPLEKFFDRISVLGDKLGPVLYQLPPNWNFDENRLENFLTNLPPAYRHVLELRDSSWINETALELLRRADVAFCIYEYDGRLTDCHVTTDFVYVRLHGPGAAYRGKYDGDTLRTWADRIRDWRGGGLDVYFYFDNDQQGYAVENARRLRELV